MHVFRFAPSPNGYLHLGHALSALLNADLAKQAGARLLLRIEDIDPMRCRPEYEQAIYEDLAWLGVEWERPVRRQAEHFHEYRAALERLEREGLVYPAFESRAEIARMVREREAATGKPWPADPDGAPLYPGDAKHLSTQERARRQGIEPFALRLDVTKALAQIVRAHQYSARPRESGDPGPQSNVPVALDSRLRGNERSVSIEPEPVLTWTETGEGGSHEITAEPERWGDVVLGRKETPASYHLAVVLDDALQGVTHVVRGLDLYESTAVHRLLQELLGLPAPIYHHHRLVLDADGNKLAKRDKSTTLRDLRAAGWTPADVRCAVGL